MPNHLAATLVALALAAGAHAAPDPVMEGPPIAFVAILHADNQSATTESPGSGRVDFLLDRPTTRLYWKATYKDTTTPVTGAHIHGPQRPGVNAGVMFDMAPNGLRKLPLEGSVVLTDAQLEYLLSGRTYVNIHTTRYPEGELRGQIDRVPPSEALTN
jgi:hypothetical protein